MAKAPSLYRTGMMRGLPADQSKRCPVHISGGPICASPQSGWGPTPETGTLRDWQRAGHWPGGPAGLPEPSRRRRKEWLSPYKHAISTPGLPRPGPYRILLMDAIQARRADPFPRSLARLATLEYAVLGIFHRGSHRWLPRGLGRLTLAMIEKFQTRARLANG